MFLMENTITAEPSYGGNFNPPGVTSLEYDKEIHKVIIEEREVDGEKKTFEHKFRLKFSHVKKEVRTYFDNLGKSVILFTIISFL